MNPARPEILKKRHAVLQALRACLDGQGFTEIESPLLVRGTAPEASIGSFAVADRYLVTSTEYQIKRLFADGCDKIYTLTKNFRTGDTGKWHNPEFTMLEWARAGASMDDIDADMEQLLRRAHEKLNGGGTLRYQGHEIALALPWKRLCVAEALNVADFELPALRRAIDAAGIKIRPQDHDDRVFLLTLLLDHAQKSLGFDRPVFLRDWPAFLTASALEKPGGLADRSELFIAGIELADGFPFLTDHKRQTETFARELERRTAEGAPPIALDTRYLDSLRRGLPPGAGMALGVDRLVMLLLDAPDLRRVMAFAWDEV